MYIFMAIVCHYTCRLGLQSGDSNLWKFSNCRAILIEQDKIRFLLGPEGPSLKMLVSFLGFHRGFHFKQFRANN